MWYIMFDGNIIGDLDGFDEDYKDMINSIAERNNRSGAGFSSASDLMEISQENNRFVLDIEMERKIRVGEYDTYNEASDVKLAIAFLVVRYHNNRIMKNAQNLF